MKIANTQQKLLNQFVKLQDDKWLKRQRIAGGVVGKTLNLLENLVKEKTTKSLIELDKIAEEFIINNGCLPTFKNYKGFPNAICQSVNKQLVHGVATNYKLQDGDIISFDLGATFEEAIGDSAITCIFGDAKSQDHINLVNATEEALNKAILSINIGKQLGVIGNTISKHAKQNGLSVIINYGGHSIEPNMPHAPPFVSNKDTLDNGIRFTPGLVLAIEPLFVIGRSSDTYILDDNWTVMCDDICAHWEDTIYLHEDHIEIITYKKNKNIPQKIYFKEK